MRRQKATEFRRAAQIAAQGAIDEQALSMPSVFPAWSGAGVNYSVGFIARHADNLYRCLTEHTSQDDWEPGTAPSLWVSIADPAEEWPDWVQPQGAHDAYEKGAKVSHGGKHWVSDAAGNVWEPGVHGWTEQA